MSNLTSHESEPAAKNSVTTWDEVRRIADEIELKIHLGSMDARDRWHVLEPRLAELEHRMKDAGQRASKAVGEELSAIWKALRELKNEFPYSY